MRAVSCNKMVQVLCRVRQKASSRSLSIVEIHFARVVSGHRIVLEEHRARVPRRRSARQPRACTLLKTSCHDRMAASKPNYRDWPHCRLHSPRAARMTEKVEVAPSAIRVQTQKKTPLELAILPPTSPTPSCGRSSACAPFARRLRFRLKPEKVARLARERLADRIQRRETDRARLARLEDRKVR